MYKNKLNKIGNLIDKIKTEINLPIVSDFLVWFYEKIEINFNKKNPLLKLSKGEIFFVKLGKNIGGELNKIRPCIIFSTKDFNGGNTIIIIPLKSYKGKVNKQFNILIKVSDLNGLELNSILDLGAIRQISKKRILNKIGNLEESYISKINYKVHKMLGLKNRDN